MLSEGRGWSKDEYMNMTEHELYEFLDDLILINEERSRQMEVLRAKNAPKR